MRRRSFRRSWRRQTRQGGGVPWGGPASAPLASFLALAFAALAYWAGAAEASAAQVGRRPFDEGRIAPAFPSGPLSQALTAFRGGRYGEAHRLLSLHDDGSAGAAFLRALAALEIGREREAEETLAGLAPRLPALEDRIHWHLGLARERRKDFKGAAAAYGMVREGAVQGDEARLSRAHALRRLGERREALDALGPLLQRSAPAWGNDLGAQARFLAAILHGELGDARASREAYLRIWASHPLAPEAVDAKLRAEAIDPRAPEDRLRVERAKHLVDAHKNEEGIQEIRALLPRLALPDPLACEARFYLGRGLRKLRRHSEAISALEPVVESCKAPDVRARALYLLATSRTIVAPEAGAKTWRRLAAELPDHSYADDALFFAAEIDRRAGRLKEARKELLSLVETHPQGDFRKEALFRLFWLERQSKRPKKGLEALRILEAEEVGTHDAGRALYWQGRVLYDLGRKVEAVAAWKSLLMGDPATYYAMLARGRLAKEDPAWLREIEREEGSEAGGGHSLDAGALEGDRHFAAALELMRLGLSAQAAEELLRIDRKAAKERAGGSPEPSLLVAWLLDRAEARRPAHHIARTELGRYIRGRPHGLAAVRYRIAFPLAYRDLIEENARRHGVPADLMQALMREESSLDPEVVSWAGAVGLTQLMPSTAASVAKRLGLGSVSPRQLRDPSLNVKIGTAYLGSLLERWKGSYALACASYNAGPGAVARWLGERGHLELDEFVEEIPIDQTRDYVKRVLGSYSAYRLVYGEGEARYPALLPAKAGGR